MRSCSQPDKRTVLRDQLHELLDPADGLVVVHSSLPHLGAGAEVREEFLKAICILAGEGLTLAFPAFTFSFCGGRGFELSRSPSETGVLADWVREGCADARRTPHPIYSFVVVGPLAERVCACPSSTTFAADSPFGFFETIDARIVMLGCGWSYCTQFHFYEEQARVPYREYKTFAGLADFGGGPVETNASMFVRNLDLDPTNDFGRAVERLRELGAIRTAAVLKGIGESVSCRLLGSVCNELLATNPWVFVAEKGLVKPPSSAVKASSGLPSFRLAILANSNAALLEESLLGQLSAAMPDRKVEVHAAPFGQTAQEILGEGSGLANFCPDFTIFADRLEDLLGTFTCDGAAPTLVDEKLHAYAALVRRYTSMQGGWLIVHTFAPLSRSAWGAAGDSREDGIVALAARANSVLRASLSDLPQVRFLDMGREAALFDGPVLDPRMWFLARIPFSEPFSRRLAARWTALVVAATGRAARLVVLDLDNTLWGGVLGEDGVSRLQIGGDYPGNAFAAFQEVLMRLSARGILLAIVSKNDENQALSALESLPEMRIRVQDIAARRINWEPKWRNVEAILAELSLGVESVLFVDDNPVEREEVRRNLPGIKVLELPDDPALFARTLLECPWVETIALTSEDFARGRSYQTRPPIVRSGATSASLDDYLATLGIKLYLQPFAPGNAARAVQLVAKTNQFNATTRRYTQRMLEELVAAGADVVVVGLEERSTPFENIGLMVLQPDSREPDWLAIDSYLLSCRVLGRGLELALVYWAAETARRRGYLGVLGEVVETERNAPIRSVYSDAGFVRDDRSGRWRLPLAGGPTARHFPPWLALVDRINVEGQGDDTERRSSASSTSGSMKIGQPTWDAASRSSIEGTLGEIVRRELQLRGEVDLSEAGLGDTPGWDSLGHVKLLLAIESSLGVRFTTDEIESTRRFRDLADVCRRKLAQRVPSSQDRRPASGDVDCSEGS